MRFFWEKEIDYLGTVFINTNDYTIQVVNNVINNELQERTISNNVTNKKIEANISKKEEQINLLLPSSGKIKLQNCQHSSLLNIKVYLNFNIT